MQNRFKFRIWDKKGKLYIYSGLIDIRFGVFSTQNLLDADRFLIEQCTGLKDKNGKLIYEGDIVKTDSGSIYYIKWDKKTSSFREEDSNLDGRIYNAGHHLSLWADIYCKNYTIIGNINENVDLLGEDK